MRKKILASLIITALCFTGCQSSARIVAPTTTPTIALPPSEVSDIMEEVTPTGEVTPTEAVVPSTEEKYDNMPKPEVTEAPMETEDFVVEKPEEPTLAATSTPTPTATSTPAPTATSTLTPTATSTPAPTATSTPTPTATSTPTPTATSTPTPTATSTPAPTATSTPAPTATSTPTPTATSTPTPTATSTPTPTATSTPFPTATPTPELTETSASVFVYEITDEKTITITGLKEGYPEEICIPRFIEEYPVTKIGDFAFLFCNRLTKIYIPNEITSIGFGGVNDCEVILRDYVETPPSKFEYSIANGEVTIEGLRDKSLFKICIPQKIEGYPVTCIDALFNEPIIDYGAYGMTIDYGQSSLLSIIIPEGVKEINQKAFYMCKSLSHVDVPNSLLNICADTFFLTPLIEKQKENKDYCVIGNTLCWVSPELSGEFQIPNGVRAIGSEAFEGCNKLTKVEIPTSVVSIFSSAFVGCDKLQDIVIPKSLMYIESSAFAGTPWLQKQKNESDFLVYGDVMYWVSPTLIGSFNIPDNVVSISDNAFRSCKELTDVFIPNSVKRIGEKAFYGCSSLKKIVVPQGVTEIGNSTFDECNQLTSVLLPNSVTQIGDRAFRFCKSLADFEIPPNVNVIGESAFHVCSSLPSVKIPEGVSVINESTFASCDSLQEIIIPEGVTKIGGEAFASCSNLTNIYIANSVTEIGKDAFFITPWLKNETDKRDYLVLGDGVLYWVSREVNGAFIVPNNVKRIESSAFYGCSKITSITLPEGMEKIGDWALHDLYNATEIKIPNSVKEISLGAFPDKWIEAQKQNKDYLILGNVLFWASPEISGEFSIPEGVTSIGTKVFWENDKLTSIIIPEGVVHIGNEAFEMCMRLEEVQLPNSLVSIGDEAFKDCKRLTEISLPANVVSIGDNAFARCWNLSKLVLSQKSYSMQWAVDYGFESIVSVE